jgi:thiol-disulfide isomerase/thioredoxin
MMKKILAISLFGILIASPAWSQKAQMIRLVDLQKIIAASTDEIKVINFWATWCAPCVKELPLLEKLQSERKDIKVSLVSMDIDLDPNPEKVHRFVDRKKIQSEVLILNERNPNDWIDKIDKKWSGALPATLVINSKNGKRLIAEVQ